MLVPFVLPFKITAVLLLVLGLVSVVVFVWRGNRFSSVLGVTTLVCFTLFIPSCAGIYRILEPIRYREFHYGTAVEITDPYILLPESATDITYHKYHWGHRARFTVTEENLVGWLSQLREDGLPFSSDEENVFVYTKPIPREYFDEYFGECEWPFVDDLMQIQGPWADNGAGFQLWHSPKTNTAYLLAGYW